MPVEYSWHEQELLAALAAAIASNEITIVHDSTAFTQGLAVAYPVQMNRIDWSAITDARRLAASHQQTGTSPKIAELGAKLREFWDAVRRENAIDDELNVIVVGDSLVDFALKLSISTLTRYLDDILSVPQHTYIFPEDLTWCFNYTAEDEAYFAKRPPPGHR